MKEFTLRNKSSNNPILTLSEKVMSEILKARPESVDLVLAKYKKDYKKITGKAPILHYEQNSKLLEHCGANESGLWQSKYDVIDNDLKIVINCFQDGFLGMTTSAGILIDLKIVESFFNLLDQSI